MIPKVIAIFVRDARLAATYKLQFALNWVSIAAGVIGLAFMARLVSGAHQRSMGGLSYFEYAVINIAFLTLELGTLDGCEKVVRNDQVYGTLPSILSTPTSMSVLAIGSTVWSFVFALVQIACYIGFGALFGLHLTHIDPVTLAAFILLSVAATIPLGVFSTAMVIVFKQGAPVKFVLSNLATIFAGVLFPVALLPGWMQHVSWMLPMTHVLNGVRGAFTGVPITHLSYDAMWLAAVSVVLFPLALLTFRAAVSRAKFDGSLSHY
ncbi:MAG: ABC transporter permease [Candidatus Lustribacter sp.]|jgi:ABC-2 type transport system permease protein